MNNVYALWVSFGWVWALGCVGLPRLLLFINFYQIKMGKIENDLQFLT